MGEALGRAGVIHRSLWRMGCGGRRGPPDFLFADGRRGRGDARNAGITVASIAR
jgi:hypothetical protein